MTDRSSPFGPATLSKEQRDGKPEEKSPREITDQTLAILQLNVLKSINDKLGFFVVLTIIGIVIAILSTCSVLLR